MLHIQRLLVEYKANPSFVLNKIVPKLPPKELNFSDLNTQKTDSSVTVLFNRIKLEHFSNKLDLRDLCGIANDMDRENTSRCLNLAFSMNYDDVSSAIKTLTSYSNSFIFGSSTSEFAIRLLLNLVCNTDNKFGDYTLTYDDYKAMTESPDDSILSIAWRRLFDDYSDKLLQWELISLVFSNNVKIRNSAKELLNQIEIDDLELSTLLREYQPNFSDSTISEDYEQEGQSFIYGLIMKIPPEKLDFDLVWECDSNNRNGLFTKIRRELLYSFLPENIELKYILRRINNSTTDYGLVDNILLSKLNLEDIFEETNNKNYEVMAKLVSRILVIDLDYAIIHKHQKEGNYYQQKLAQKLFDDMPNLQKSSHAQEVLSSLID